MKYFIGFLMTGKAGAWHTGLTKHISEKFNTWKLHEKLPPHISFFHPFESGDATAVTQVIKDWVANKTIPGDFILSDFDHFDDKVVFAKVETSQFVKDVVKELRACLQEIPGMPKGDWPIWHPHATLANRLLPEEIQRIWEYVKNLEKPNFTIPFDNITMFCFVEDRKWIVEESFKLNS